MKKNILLLLLIVLIAGLLRFWQLGKVPSSPDWDEVALGYNAYSIMQTGRDEYGKFLPIVLRSYDDYKPALYAYLAIPSISLLGLTVEAVRLPSALLGTLTIIFVYFLTKELFKKEEIALVSSFLLAISPWHIQFSRIAFESNAGLSFNIFAILLFLKGLKKPIWLILSSLFFGLSIYVYQSEKIFVPLLVLSLLLIFRKDFMRISLKFISAAFFIGLLIVLPMLTYIITNKNAFDRAKGVSIFSEETPASASQKLLDDIKNNDKVGLVFDNRRFILGKEVISGYLSHFDLKWLFLNGDIARHHAPEMGLLYLFELPFLLTGIYLLAFGKFDRRTKIFIFSWFLIAPIPASVTSGVPHAVRTLNFLPTFQIFTSIGLLTVLSMLFLDKHKLSGIEIKYPIILFLGVFSVFNFLYYLDQYFIQQNFLNAYDWQYGYEKTFAYVSKISQNYKKIVISNQPPMDQSYMFVLFYLKYPPSKYQLEGQYASGGFRENHKFGKFEFRPLHWDSEERAKDILYVGRPFDFHVNADIQFTSYYPDGQPAMLAAR